MRLARLGAAFPTRLSFMRTLIRRLHGGRARVTRPLWQIDAGGYGRAVYTVRFNDETLSLVCFSQPLEPERRTDRVIAEAWDTTYALYDGVPDAAALERLAANVPRQEAGRFTPRELVLCRANRSVRLFDQVVECLARGEQPDLREVGRVGYLLRTTAVYGNGKFGIADRLYYAHRPALAGPFQAELLTVWLIRGFTHDLVEHVAHARGGARAVRLDPAIRRCIGIGNATGLGMAPFLVNHPVLLNNWINARETALARVRSIERAGPATIARFRALVARARRHAAQWNVEDARQRKRIEVLRGELAELEALAGADWLARPGPWERVVEASRAFSLEGQEMVASLVIEPHGHLVDDLTATMADDEGPRLEPGMHCGRLAVLVEELFGWALQIDFSRPENCARFWYISEEKMEPRLGNRFEEQGAERELPLDIARQVQTLAAVLACTPADLSVAELLMRRPDLRHIVRRVQTLARHPYAEIRDNLIGADLIPIDMFRAKLAFFGASKFDPRSDRWIRITLYQGAPTADDIAEPDHDDWCFAVAPAAAGAPP